MFKEDCVVSDTIAAAGEKSLIALLHKDLSVNLLWYVPNRQYTIQQQLVNIYRFGVVFQDPRNGNGREVELDLLQSKQPKLLFLKYFPNFCTTNVKRIRISMTQQTRWFKVKVKLVRILYIRTYIRTLLVF